MASTHAVLNVPSVSCNHCKMAIEGAVKDIEGVDSVDVDVQGKSVSVEFDPDKVSIESVEAAVQEEGYDVAGRHIFE